MTAHVIRLTSEFKGFSLLGSVDARPYQDLAVKRCLTHWAAGRRRVLLVSPTGSGKTHMGAMVAARGIRAGKRIGWLTHTRDLLTQTRDRLQAEGFSVGIVAAGHEPDPGAAVQVLSVQTLNAREHWVPLDVLIIDEAHHFVADDWSTVRERLEGQFVLGLTATPERADGRAMRECFDELVVAAHYSELMRDGHIVPARVFRPEEMVDKGLALDPLEGYLRHGEQRSGFVYCRTVAGAHEAARRFSGAGIPAECIEAKSDTDERRAILARFIAGETRILTNVYCLTEGIDVPHAGVAVLARAFLHVSQYLQTCGRVLRPAPGKQDAIVIDLPGISHLHGIPTEDREYSLDGQGICRTEAGKSIRVCLTCGYAYEHGVICPRCGTRGPVAQRNPRDRIHGVDLSEVHWDAPEWQREEEFRRLSEEAAQRGHSDYWVIQKYRAKFGIEPPEIKRLNDADRKRSEYIRLLGIARKLGRKDGWAAHRYKATYGAYPPSVWRQGT